VPSPLPLDELCDRLQDPSVYSHDPDSITIKQTHISILALVPPFVYKIKKPVDFGFLDFTTLAKRREACESEVRLNRRLCSDTYLGVVPLTLDDDTLRIDPKGITDTGTVDEHNAGDDRTGGGGSEGSDSGGTNSECGGADDPGENVMDVAVKMRYLSADGFLHQHADNGTLSEDDIDAVVDTLVSFYEERETAPEIAEQGWVDHLRVNTNENFEQTADHVGDLIPQAAYAVLQDYTDRFYDAHAALLNRRRTGGHFIDGHGDLRLEHIHRSDRGICIYDCIEFNDRFRHLDVASDVAFLAMDLDGHGERSLSRRFVQKMSDAMEDPELPDMVPFYKTYRAYVRGKVEGMRAYEDEVPDDEREVSANRAREHYRWALRYAVAGSRPMAVVVMGQTGSGKTTQAEACAHALGWRHVSSDRIRKEKAGIPLHERTPPARRDEVYSREMTDAVYDEMRLTATQTVREDDRGVVLDATYSSDERRSALRDHFRQHGVPYAVVELTADTDERRTRLQQRSSEETVSDARPDVMDTIDQRYQPPSALWDTHHLRVSTRDEIHETTTDILRALIRLQDG